MMQCWKKRLNITSLFETPCRYLNEKKRCVYIISLDTCPLVIWPDCRVTSGWCQVLTCDLTYYTPEPAPHQLCNNGLVHPSHPNLGKSIITITDNIYRTYFDLPDSIFSFLNLSSFLTICGLGQIHPLSCKYIENPGKETQLKREFSVNNKYIILYSSNIYLYLCTDYHRYKIERGFWDDIKMLWTVPTNLPFQFV